MTTSKRKRKRSYRVRISENFPWHVLEKLIQDLESDFLSYGLMEDLQEIKQVVRHRDIEKYVSLCKTRWALKELNSEYGGSDGQDLQKVRLLRMLTCMQKYNYPNSPFDQEKNAIDAFLKYEAHCAAVNDSCILYRMLTDEEDPNLSSYDSVTLYPILHHAREFIAGTLGVNVDLQDLHCRLRHGPGSSADKRGRFSIPVEKYIPPIGTTSLGAELIAEGFTGDERWMRTLFDASFETSVGLFEQVDTAPIEFVPKDASIYRSIMLEPTGNVAFQLAIDDFIKERLRTRWGLDLRNQSKNQRLATRYSKDGDGVTIDLSGASDCIALMWLLFFPEKWAELIMQLRTPCGVLPTGQKILFEKISSMGNGFTFAVETLIFSAILYGVVRNNGDQWADVLPDLAVYGDDIICPKRYYTDLAIALKKTGFILNREKSFSTGPIRESCGIDSYNGFRIDRPTIKDKPLIVPDLYVIHNLLRDVEQRYGFDLTITRMYLIKLIPPQSRYYGPVVESMDCYIHTESESVLKKKFRKRFCRMFYVVKYMRREHPRMRKGDKRWELWQDFLPMLYLSRPGKTPTTTSVSLDMESTIFQKRRVVVHTSVAYI